MIEMQYICRGKARAVSEDEEPGRCDLEKIPTMRPAFSRDGTVTAASSSSISDGAAALVLLGENRAREIGLEPLASLAGHASHAQEPEWFTTAPGPAIEKVLARAGWAVATWIFSRSTRPSPASPWRPCATWGCRMRR